MFERYTQTARRVIFAARYIAGRVGSDTIDTEHLLLGLLSTDKGLARRFFGSPWAAEAVWKSVEQRKPIRESPAGPREIPLSDASKRVLRFAAEEADLASDDEIRTQHLLLGTLRENRGLAGEITRERGFNLVEIRRSLQESPHDDSRDEKFVREDRAFPPDIAELVASAESIRKRIEEAIAGHDFATAKAYSDEEREQCNKLFSLYRQHGMNDWIYG